MCVCVSHLDAHTHRGAQRLVYRHMQTEERGADGEVAGQGDGVRQDHGMFDKETRDTLLGVRGSDVWCVCVCVYLPLTNTLSCSRQTPAACK